MERVEAETRGDRRTRGEAQDDAAEHQRAERGERQPVNRPPPFAQRRWLCARGHGVPKPKSPPYWWHRHGFQGIKKSYFLVPGWRRDYLFVTIPGSARTRSRNASPRTSKLRYWSNEAQAGDSSTTGSAAVEASARRARQRERQSSVPADLVRHVAPERDGELLRRLADQIGFADARKKLGSGSMPPVFGLPPAIQKMSLKQASACAAASALVRLRNR